MARNSSGNYTRPVGSTAVNGATASSTAYNGVLSDLETEITDSLSRSNKGAMLANLDMGSNKIVSLASATAADDAPTLLQLQTNAAAQASSVGGTADAITLTFTPSFTAYVSGMRIRWVSGGANTVTNPTANVSTLGAKTIKKGAGAALIAGDTGASGYICEAVYNGTDLILLNPASGVATTVSDATFRIADNGDPTKIIAFEASGITAGNTRTITIPDASLTMVGLTTSQTLTTKTIDLASNTLTGTLAQFNTACSNADFASLAGSEALTNKTISLGSNTISGTTAQFNTALSDGDFATLAGSETLTNKTLTDPIINNARVKLTSDRTYYVRADGSDSNNGLTNSSGGAFATKQKAIDTALALDFGGKTVTIQIVDSTAYTDSCTVYAGVGILDASYFVIQGNSGTPANVRINVTSGNCFNVTENATVTIKDMELRTTTSGSCINIVDGGYVEFGNLVFGACAGTHVNASSAGKARAISDCTVSGNATAILGASLNSTITLGTITLTISGSPTITSAAVASSCGTINVSGATLTGSYTGLDSTAQTNGVVLGGTGFSGSGSTSTSTGGQIT